MIETIREGGYRVTARVMRRTLRMRLALLYGGVFFASGVILLGIVVALFTGKSTREAAPVPGQPVTGGVSIADRQHGTDLHALLISSANRSGCHGHGLIRARLDRRRSEPCARCAR